MLQHWLKPVRFASINGYDHLENSQLGKRINIHTESEFPELKEVKVALLGIGEAEAHTVRQELYQMIWSFGDVQLADIGDVRKTDANFIIPVLLELRSAGILPIIIANSKTYLDIQYKAYLQSQDAFKMVLVDSNGGRLLSRSIRENISFDILNRPQFKLVDYCLLAHQAHLMDPEIVSDVEHRHFSSMRLGAVQENIKEAEPLIRDASAFSFSLSSIRYSEAPGQRQNYPSGLYSEEACQLCRYAGISDHVDSFGIYGYVGGIDFTRVTQTMVAQLIWYFLEGYAQRKSEWPDRLQQKQEYLVNISAVDQSLCFVRSLQSDRWWMKWKENPESDQYVHIPCSSRDYQIAAKNELSDRLYQHIIR